jgi:hypothetical protein
MLSLIGEGYGGVIPDQNGCEHHTLTVELISKLEENVLQYIEAMEKVAARIYGKSYFYFFSTVI